MGVMQANDPVSDLFNPADLAEIEHLELLSRRVVDGFLAGQHRSRLKGGSAEFLEHRGYSPGDEIRLIDWKVFAKSDRYYIKEYIEQTSLQTILLLDGSGSMRFGLSTPSKFHYARAVALCLARLVLRQSDAAGLAVIDSSLRRFVPPRSAARHFQAILENLRGITPSGITSLATNLTDIALKIKRRGLMVVLSDCFEEPAALRQALHFLRARGHDVIILHVMAPEELSFDFSGWSRFQCLESEGVRLDLDPSLIRKEYLEKVREFLAELKHICGETGTDYFPLETSQPLGEALGYYLRHRTARLKQV